MKPDKANKATYRKAISFINQLPKAYLASRIVSPKNTSVKPKVSIHFK